MLNAVALFSLALVGFFYHHQFRGAGLLPDNSLQGAAMVMMMGSLLYWLNQWPRQRSLRRVLESELLSIQSSAVVWRVVTMSHLLAVTLAMHRNRSYQNYTSYLALLALDFNRKFYKPHAWLRHWEDVMDSTTLFDELDKVIPNDDIIAGLRKPKPANKIFVL